MTKTIILAYHDIDSNENLTDKEDLPTIETVVTVDEFEKHMRHLSVSGFSVMSVKEYFKKRKENKITEKDIVLTFDDGHISNYQYALPILQKYSFTATFFIISDFICKPDYMGITELKEMLAFEMEIGSHGVSHSYLTELKHENVVNEIAESKKILEKLCGKKIDVFAYPGGHQNKKIVDVVGKSGYIYAVSCITGRNISKTNHYLLRRIEIRRGTSLKEFQNAINPTTIIFFQGVDLLKLLMKKTLGLKKYEFIRQKLFHLYPFKR